MIGSYVGLCRIVGDPTDSNDPTKTSVFRFYFLFFIFLYNCLNLSKHFIVSSSLVVKMKECFVISK